MSLKVISIASGCYNEEGNIREFYDRCKAILDRFPEYDYEFVIEDNCSTDGTRKILRQIASEDRRFKVIFNSNNFGPVRSPYNSLFNTTGDAAVWMCCDLQEPPELIEEFVRKWQDGYKVVAGVRSGTQASKVMELVRNVYYWLLMKSSQGFPVIPRFTGFGLYDRVAVEAIKSFKDPYPYFRGLVSEIGFKRALVPFVQDKRKHGETKNNFFTLYDQAMTGFVNNTKLPLRLAVFLGFVIGLVSFGISLCYLILKLVFWDQFQLGMAPLIIALFFFSAIQLIFIGVIGEYIGAIWTQVKNKPLVIEEERINF